LSCLPTEGMCWVGPRSELLNVIQDTECKHIAVWKFFSNEVSFHNCFYVLYRIFNKFCFATCCTRLLQIVFLIKYYWIIQIQINSFESVTHFSCSELFINSLSENLIKYFSKTYIIPTKIDTWCLQIILCKLLKIPNN